MDIKQQINQQQQELEYAVERALAIAKDKSDQAEVAISKVSGLSVSTLMEEVENIEFNNDGALGITVYKGKRKGSASTSDLSEDAIKKTVEAALNIAEYTSVDPCAGLAPEETMITEVLDLDLCHPDAIEPEEAIQYAIETEKHALAFDPRIKQSDGASYNSHYGVKVYGNSHGVLGSVPSSRHSLSCSVIGVGDNEEMERDYSYTVARNKHHLWSPERIGKEAAEKTVKRLDPRKLDTMQVPVLFEADVATGILGHLIGAISGGSLYRNASFLQDRLDTQILPDWFNIEEKAHILGGLASSPFDNEGAKTKDAQIITDGVLSTYLLTSYAARKMKMQPTGHAGGIYNWFVKSTGQDFSQLVKQMDKGLIVTELMGQGVNTVTGDYSRGASGFWVENGVIQYPVSEITIAGNLKDMLMNIVAVGYDVETRSQIQTGSILIESMKIAGN